VLAELGGLFQTFFLIAMIFTRPITKLKYYVELINEIFVINNDEVN
jgi:hypothetical protein